MGAWVPVTRVSDQVFTLRRNPYFVGVDPDGNQLPYLDEVRFTFFADIQALNLAAIAGEMDMQERHIQMTNYPVFKENEKSGKYRVITWPTFGGADAVVAFNTSYKADPELGKLFANKDFRVALSYAINRDQIKESVFLGLGEAAAGRAGPLAPVLPRGRVGEEVHAVQARRGQQAPGRHRPRQEGRAGDPAPAERQAPVDRARRSCRSFAAWPDIAQLISKDWEKVGVKTIVQIRERALHFRMRDANELQTEMWNEDTTAFPFTGNAKVDVRNNPILTTGPLYLQWYQTKGKEGMEPPAPIKKIVELVDTARTVGPDGQIKAAQEIFRIWADNVYEIGTVGLTPMVQGVVVVNTRLRNVPTTLGNDWPLRSPGNARPEQFFFTK